VDDLDDLVESTADWQVSVPAYPGATTRWRSFCMRAAVPDTDRLVLDGRPTA